MEEEAAQAVQDAGVQAAQDAGPPAANGGETATVMDSSASPGPAPQAPGAAVAKSAPNIVASDPTIASGGFDDPAALFNPSADPFAVPAEAATGEAVPLPPRNPKR